MKVHQRFFSLFISVLILSTLGISALTASAALTEYNEISVDYEIIASHNSDYEYQYRDNGAGVAFALFSAPKAFISGTETLVSSASFTGIDNPNVIVTDWTDVQSGTSTEYVNMLYWVYVEDSSNLYCKIFNGYFRDLYFFGFIPGYNSIELHESVYCDKALERDHALDASQKYLISFACNYSASVASVMSCNAISFCNGVKRAVYLFDGTTNADFSLYNRCQYGDLSFYRITNTIPGAPGDTENSDDTGKQQLEVSNNILENIKNIFIKISDLPGSIADLITASLKLLFIPSDDFILVDGYIRQLEERYPFLFQVREIFSSLFEFEPGDEIPTFTVTLYRTEVPIVNFEPYSGIISIFHPIIIALAWAHFIRWCVDYVPQLLGGIS